MDRLSGRREVHLALSHTDTREGLDGLATLIQEHLKKDPFSGHLFIFRGKNASLLKILLWDGTGLCLFTKRIDRGNFLAAPGSSVTLSPAQLAMPLKGMDWRTPERFWGPLLAGCIARTLDKYG